MKTKEVVIEGFANTYSYLNEIEFSSRDIAFHQTKDKALIAANDPIKYKAVKCKLILEVPEKEITITESEFNEKYRSAAKNCEYNNDVYFNYSKMLEELKKQLFGEE